MQILRFNEFLRSLKQNKDTAHSMLLGAGASIESGMPSATDCIWDWKHDIFLSQNPSFSKHFKNIKIDNVKASVQNWLDIQNIYPLNGSEDEYSYYAEKAYPIAEDRRKYFQTLTYGKTPSIGYHLICMLAEEKLIKNIWTTNFDGLMLKTAHNYALIPIEVTLESQQRVFRNDVNKEMLCIELHGDYKYGDLKNTKSELDTQNDKFIEALQHELKNRNLIVIGYSGRDKSLMAALETAYTQQGSGRLYWCGYGENCPKPVENLLNSIIKNGRYGFYIPSDGFDKTMLDISQFCMSENNKFINKVEDLKKNICNRKDFVTTDFTSVQGNLSKLVESNLYPIAFPKNCYQFKMKFTSEEKPWNYCKSLIKYSIVAVYNDGYIYAFGSKSKIQSICGDKIIGEITISPITKDLIKGNGNYQKLLINTVTVSLAKTNNLNCSNNIIWDTSDKFFCRVKEQLIYAFLGIELSLVFDNKYSYISLVPTYYFEDKPLLDKESKKIFADYFSKKINNANSNQAKPNINIYNYLQSWKNKVIGDNKQKITFPNDSFDGFDFTFGANSAIVGINKNTNYSINIPKNLDRKRIIFSGTECSDPELMFYNSNTNAFENDFHPMRGLVNNKPYDYIMSKQTLKSGINLGVICPTINDDHKLYDFLNKLNQNHKTNVNVDYVLPFPGFYSAFDLALNIPLVNSKYWLHINKLESQDITIAARQFAESITQKIDCLAATETDVIIIYIPKSYEWLTSYSDSNSQFDLHNYIKAYAAQKNISTQFVREKTIESDPHLFCQIMWALSLALYVKSGRIPFTIAGLQQDTAFAGIGYSVNASKNGTDIVIGCSHIYSYDGQGLKYKLSKINDNGFFLDRKKNPYLSESESYRLGLGIKDLFYKSFSELPKRVVVHKRTPFKQAEIDGLVKSLSSSGITQIDLLEINYEEKIKCFEYDKHFNIDSFPIRRGLVFPQNKNTIQLYTHGIAPSVRNPNYKYFQGGKTLPKPLRIVKHYGSSNMQQIASEILGLSKMNWNSFGLYSKLPCTLESSNAVARIGSLLSEYEGAMYDYRFFM